MGKADKFKLHEPRMTAPELSRGALRGLAAVAEHAAQMIRKSGAFTDEGLSFNKKGDGIGVYSPFACKRDVLGWIYVASVQHAQNPERSADYIGERTLAIRKRSMIAINDDDGCEAVGDALVQASESFRLESEQRPLPMKDRHRSRG